jgi:hypothetical protein
MSAEEAEIFRRSTCLPAPACPAVVAAWDDDVAAIPDGEERRSTGAIVP